MASTPPGHFELIFNPSAPLGITMSEEGKSLRIGSVESGSQLGKRGVLAGDTILAAAGKAVSNLDELRKVVQEQKRSSSKNSTLSLSRGVSGKGKSNSSDKFGSEAPRRARKKTNEAPVFLQKTFEMIDTCPSDIAGWSENGDTFIIKNMEEFTELLPNFFTHKNFRSFVRQLNFYGFRKLRTDGALNSERPAHWWEFRHEKFLRGQKHLLAQIKRGNHFEPGSAEQGEAVEDLKSEVSTLRDRVEEMTGTIENLTGLVEALLHERQTGEVLDLDSDLHELGLNSSSLVPEPPTLGLGLSPLDIPGGDGKGKKRKLPQQGQGEGQDQHRDQGSGPVKGLSDVDGSQNERKGEAVVGMALRSGEEGTPLSNKMSIDSTTTEILRQLSLDSANDSGDYRFDLRDDLEFDSEDLGTGNPTLRVEDGRPASVEMPPVAPYLATAAIGALFTKLTSDTSGQVLLNAQTGKQQEEGGALMRTLSSGSVTVEA